MMKKIIVSLLIMALLTGCSSSNDNPNSNSSMTQNVPQNSQQPVVTGEVKTEYDDEFKASDEEKFAYATSTSENDTDMGLKTVKIDYAQGNLTNEQKMVIKYFSRDYMFVNSIEALQRYNKVFDNSVIKFYAYVDKVTYYDSERYELLVSLLSASDDTDYNNETKYMIIHGESSDERYIQGDMLLIYGRYNGIITKEIDGKSYIIPDVSVHGGYLIRFEIGGGWTPSRFTMKEVKQIAKCIFGENITISKPTLEEAMDNDGDDGFYVCTLDDQSNAKFGKYYFFEKEGKIYAASHLNTSIEFSPDMKHFFLFIYDYHLETLTLEYYDHNLKKIWKREFEDTTSASYDFTKNNVYLCANNELYIININTGEDVYGSKYIGAKTDIRKISQGLLAISEAKSDAFMLMDLQGNIKWKVNAQENVSQIDAIQVVDDRLVINACSGNVSYYYVIDIEDGSLIQTSKVERINFANYD